MKDQNLVEEILRACERRLRIVSEYYTLAALPTLDENKAQQMEKFLKLAERDLLLSFLLDEADHIVGHELGLINADEIHEQQNRLQQAIDKTWITVMLKNESSEDSLKQAQVYLQRTGFYNGPIDGQYNELTQEAFSNLWQEVKQQYRLDDEQLFSATSVHHRDVIERIVAEQDSTIDRQESNLRSLEVWKNYEYGNNTAY